MLPGQHPFGGGQNYPHDHTSFLPVQAQHHQHLQAQQSQYGMQARGLVGLPATSSSVVPGVGNIPGGPSPAPSSIPSMMMATRATEEDQKVYGWIAELISGGSRETALLELSKKREQVDDLALILWHSFGECTVPLDRTEHMFRTKADMVHSRSGRCHDFTHAGNHLSISPAHAIIFDSGSFQQGMQCPGFAPMCCLAQ